MAAVCGQGYDHPTGYDPRRGEEATTAVYCTYIAGHTSKHSWETLKVQDEADAEARDQRERMRGIGHDDETPSDVQALLDAITNGHADPYLEAILAVTHNRKRALRGTRGFGNL
jgi:hypothetical protein